MNIYSEHLYFDGGVQHDRVHQMGTQNLRPEYLELKAVPSEQQDHAYLVSKVSVLSKPFEEADVAADRVEIPVCSCDDYHFNRSKGFENGDISVTDIGKCKHCIAAFREEKAMQDENQTQL